MSFSSRLLIRNPDRLTKLKSEINTILGNEKNLTRAHIQRMTYLHNVIKESEASPVLPGTLFQPRLMTM